MVSSFRDIKRKARRDLHSIMRVPAYYLLPAPMGSAEEYEDPILVHVRVHDEFEKIGEPVSRGDGFSERSASTPRIIFMREDVDKPTRRAVVSVAEGEAYRVENVDPADGITVQTEVTRLRSSEMTGLPYPDDDA